VGHSSGQASLPRELNQRSALARIHGEWLLAHDVLSSFERCFCLIKMKVVRSADVDCTYGGITDQFVERRISAIESQLTRSFLSAIWRAAQNSAYWNAETPQSLK